MTGAFRFRQIVAGLRHDPYAEGQRRYVESLSAYARQFLELMQKPDVDHIEGLSPAISIEQKTRQVAQSRARRSERSRKFTIICASSSPAWACPIRRRRGHLPIESQTVSQMADRVLAASRGNASLRARADRPADAKGEYRKEFAESAKERDSSASRSTASSMSWAQCRALDKKLKHDVECGGRSHRGEAGYRQSPARTPIETALNLADGLVIAEFADAKENGEPKRLLMSSKFACPVSGFTILEIEPRLFSFNNPHGACPACDGLGTQLYFDPALIVPDESLTLRKGAIGPWSKSSSPYNLQTLEALAKHYKFSLNEPWGRPPQTGEGHHSPRLRRRRNQIHLRRRPALRRKPRRRSKASFPISSVVSRRPIPPGCAKSSSVSRTRAPATSATAIG